MSDVVNLIDRLERLHSGHPLADDGGPYPVLGTKGRVRENTAACRVMHIAITGRRDHVPARLACELYDGFDTIIAALRFWDFKHANKDTHHD